MVVAALTVYKHDTLGIIAYSNTKNDRAEVIWNNLPSSSRVCFRATNVSSNYFIDFNTFA